MGAKPIGLVNRGERRGRMGNDKTHHPSTNFTCSSLSFEKCPRPSHLCGHCCAARAGMLRELYERWTLKKKSSISALCQTKNGKSERACAVRD